MAAQAIIVGGTILSAVSEIQGGRSARARGAEQKVLFDIAAGQAEAVGQRKALEEKRQAKLMASRALAIAAAGGAAQDVDNLIADIEGEGIYRASLAMYEAETEAEQLRMQGEFALQEGAARSRASKLGAIGTVLTGAGMAYAAGSRPAKAPVKGG